MPDNRQLDLVGPNCAVIVRLRAITAQLAVVQCSGPLPRIEVAAEATGNPVSLLHELADERLASMKTKVPCPRLGLQSP